MSRTTPDIQHTSKHDIEVVAVSPRQSKLKELYGKIHTEVRDIPDIHKKVSEFHDAPTMRQVEIPDPGYVRAWISLDGHDTIALRIPTALEKDMTYVLPAGENTLKITKLDKNGYNSEYEILDQTGRRWTIIGTMFTTKSPEYSKKEVEIQKLQEDIRKRESLIQLLAVELRDIDRTLRSAPPKKSVVKKGKKNIPNDISRRDHLRRRKDSILGTIIPNHRKDILDIQNEISPLMEELKRIHEYTTFKYTPYQSHLNTARVHQEGMKHLGGILIESYRGLTSAGSVQITEKNTDGTKETRTANIADIHKKSPPELVLLLNIIERMDYMMYYETVPARTEIKEVPIGGKKKGTKRITIQIPAIERLRDQKEIEAMMSRQSGRALTTFGLNKDAAFSWQRSTVGALGMAQLMPGTYKLFQDKYSVLRVADIPDTHEQGAKNQRISMQFQIMHLYDEYNSLPSWIRENYDTIIKDPQAKLGLYSVLAAGYNGSITRTLSEAGLSSSGEHTIQELYPERLKERFAHNKERLTYVMKLEYLMKIYYSGKKAKK